MAALLGAVAVDEGGGLAVVGEGLTRGVGVGFGGSAGALAAFAGFGWGGGTGGCGVGEIELNGFWRGLGRGSLLWGGGAGVVYT